MALVGVAVVGPWLGLGRERQRLEAPRISPAPRKAVRSAPPPPPTGTLTLRGRVVDGGGPVEGAVVRATFGGQPLGGEPSPCAGEEGVTLVEAYCAQVADVLAELAEGRFGEAVPVGRTRSGADGAFELSALPQGPFTLWAEAAGRGIAVVTGVEAGREGLALRLQTGRMLQGRVVGDGGEPLAGASVTALSPDFTRYFDAVSGPDGRFAIGPVPTGGYVLVARLGERLPAHVWEGGGPVELRLSLPLWLSGRVTRDGRAVAGARVEAKARGDVAGEEAGADGRFRLGPLRPGTYEVEAYAGRERGAEYVKLPPGVAPPEVEVRLIPGAALSGLIRDERGAPVAQARIRVVGFLGERATASGADGRYRLEHLGPGEYSVTVEARGYRGARLDEARLTLGEDLAHDFELARGVALSGQVLDEDGQPVPDALVTASDPDGEDMDDVTGRDGTFSLEGLVPGDYQLWVDNGRYQSMEVPVAARAPGEGLKVVLRRGAAVEGQVLDAAGRPVPDANVTSQLLLFNGSTHNRGTVRTDADGRFRLEGLTEGNHRVLAWTRGSARWTGLARVTLRGLEPARVVIRCGAGQSLRGRVVDGKGAALPDVDVMAYQDEPRFRPSISDSGVDANGAATTDDGGGFEIHNLAPGAYQVFCPRVGCQLRDGPTVEAGGGPVTLVVRPQTRLRVLREDGSPLTLFELQGVPVTAPGGEYTVPDTHHPEAVFEVSAPGLAAAQVRLGPDARGRVTEVVLHPGRTVRGQVVDGRTGAPLPGAELDARLRPPGESVPRSVDARTGPDGAFTLRNVSEGNALVEVSKDGYRAAVLPLPPGEATLKVALVAVGELMGRVLWAGAPVAFEGLRVTLTGPSQAETSLERDGSFTFADLPLGEYQVTLSKPDYDPETGTDRPIVLDSARVTVTGRELARVVLITPAELVTGEATPKDDEPENEAPAE